MDLNERNKKIGSWMTKHKIITGVGLFVFIIIMVSILSGGKPAEQNTAASSTTSQNSKVNLGDEAVLNLNKDVKDCSGQVTVALDEKAEDAIIKASVANDDYGIAEVISAGNAFLVNNCAKVKVIEVKTGIRKIRILDGVQVNKSGWVPYEFLHK